MSTHDADGDGHGDGALQQADADHDGRQHGQVERHGEVLDHEDGEHDGGLAVRDAAEVADGLGDDAGRGDPGDAGQGDGRDRAPAEEQGEGRAGEGVEERVDDAGGLGLLEVGEQLARRVLEAEQREQQDDADLAADREEVAAGVERDEPALCRTRVRRSGRRGWARCRCGSTRRPSRLMPRSSAPTSMRISVLSCTGAPPGSVGAVGHAADRLRRDLPACRRRR